MTPTLINWDAIGASYGSAAAKIGRAIEAAMPADGRLNPWRNLLARAQRGAYSEYFGEFPAPITQLVEDLRAAGAEDLAQRAIDGEFDADSGEAERWAGSSEAQSIFKELAKPRPTYSDVSRKGRRQRNG